MFSLTAHQHVSHVPIAPLSLSTAFSHQVFCNLSTVFNEAESKERVIIFVFTLIVLYLWVWKIGYGISFQIIFCFYTAAVSGIVTCCNSAVLFCSILSSLSIFSTKMSEVTIFFPGWIISFTSEERAIDLKMASILITMVTLFLSFLVSYPQTALLLLVRDYGTAWRGQMWYL